MTQLQPQSKTLKNYTQQDFRQWKEDGFSKIFFKFLKDKSEDIKKMVVDDFSSWAPMSGEKLKIYENRQAFYRCLIEVLETDFESIDDYYKAIEEENEDGNV